MALERLSQSGELIWVTQRARLQEIRGGKGFPAAEGGGSRLLLERVESQEC